MEEAKRETVRAADPSAMRAVGSMLRESVTLVLRHWLILLISLVTLSEIYLVIIGFLGRCFGSYELTCDSSWATLGNLPQWVIQTGLDQLAAFFVLAVAFYFLFSSAGSEIAESVRLRRSSDRALLFFGRVALIWFLVLLPIWAIDIAFTRLIELMSMDGISSNTRWVLFMARTAVVIGIAAVLHARMAFYLPSVAYESAPRSLWVCWRQTRNVSGRLIAVFLVISVVGEAAHTVFFVLAQRSPSYFKAVDVVSSLLGVRSDYVLRHLASSAASIVTGVPGTLVEAAASLVAFRRLMPAAEQTTADIFS
jgi:hypothetical protein